MALSFFRALNPNSENSGIATYSNNFGPQDGKEWIDLTLGKHIHKAFNSNLDYFSGLDETYHILVGSHFFGVDYSKQHYEEDYDGEKGLLDYLIFPLIARKLIADALLPEREERTFGNMLAIAVAIPLEIVRFSAGIALTLLLAPIVALVHLFKALLTKNNDEHASTPNMAV